MISPEKENITQSCKLDFEVTNNVVEYEAFILGLQLARSLKVKNLRVFTDSKLILRQVRSLFQAKNCRLGSYRNEIWDTIENTFDAFNITFIPTDENLHADSLAISAISFKIPNQFQIQYQIQIKYRSPILDNLKQWKIFEDDEQLKSFLQVIDEFYVLQIEEDNSDSKEATQDKENSKLKSKVVDHDIIQLSNNFIPKGLVSLDFFIFFINTMFPKNCSLIH